MRRHDHGPQELHLDRRPAEWQGGGRGADAHERRPRNRRLLFGPSDDQGEHAARHTARPPPPTGDRNAHPPPRRQPQVVCTLGPSTETKEKVGELVDAGMAVARLNFSHVHPSDYSVSVVH